MGKDGADSPESDRPCPWLGGYMHSPPALQEIGGQLGKLASLALVQFDVGGGRLAAEAIDWVRTC